MNCAMSLTRCTVYEEIPLQGKSNYHSLSVGYKKQCDEGCILECNSLPVDITDGVMSLLNKFQCHLPTVCHSECDDAACQRNSYFTHCLL